MCRARSPFHQGPLSHLCLIQQKRPYLLSTIPFLSSHCQGQRSLRPGRFEPFLGGQDEENCRFVLSGQTPVTQVKVFLCQPSGYRNLPFPRHFSVHDLCCTSELSKVGRGRTTRRLPRRLILKGTENNGPVPLPPACPVRPRTPCTWPREARLSTRAL